MAFPDTPLDLRTELDLSGTWTDVSTYNDHGPITVSRGHPDESTQTSPSSLALTLTNTDGRFSSKNPTGPYYGSLGRNVPGRVSIAAQSNYMRLEDAASGAWSADSVSLEIGGDIDVRADFTSTGIGIYGAVLAAKCLTGSWAGIQNTHFSWLLQLNPDMTAGFWWSANGTAINVANSTVAVPLGRIALRATLATGTGVVTFYTAATMGGSWTQLGSTVSPTGAATSIFTASALPLSVGWVQNANVTAAGISGRVWEFQLLNGIGGTLVADPVFSSQTAGVSSFADSQSNTWTMFGTGEISSRDYRAHAELAGWPQNQDPTGKTVLVNVSGGGLLRRKGRSSNPLFTPVRRYYTSATAPSVAAYWPMEDANSGTTLLASATGGIGMSYDGSPQLASASPFQGSAALPNCNGSVLSAPVSYSGTWTDNDVRWLMEIPGGGEANNTVVATIAISPAASTPVAAMKVTYTTASGGSLTLTAYGPTGSTIFTSSALTGVNGKALAVQAYLTGLGNYGLAVLAPGQSASASATGGAAALPGTVLKVVLNPDAVLTGTVFGHLAVLPALTAITGLSAYQCPDGSTAGALNGWNGEPAGVRFGRLCGEESVQFRGLGSLTGSMQMGVQTAQALTSLLQECADADRGVWFEPRQVLGWGYLARSSLYNQAAAVTVTYTQDHLSMWSADPVEDDQYTVNDVTAQDSGGSGSSARAYAAPGQPITGGRLSTQAPPGGVGTYDASVSVNLYQDSALPDRASWELHLGTVDEPRYPGIVLDLTNRDLSSLFWPILGLDLGQRVAVNSPPGWLPPDPVSQLAAQLQEVLWSRQLDFTITGVPERPYEVAAAGTAHADTDGTTLNAGVASGVASMSFATAAGEPLWSTAGGDYPVDVMIAGERVTVTAMSGSSSPQTATVTRSVNGVVKAQASGAAVNVYPSPVAAL